MNIRWLQCSLVLLISFNTSWPMHVHMGALQDEVQICPGASCACFAVVCIYACCMENGLYWQAVDWSVHNAAQQYCCTINGAWPCNRKPIIKYFDYEACAHVKKAEHVRLQHAANRTDRISDKSKMQ